MAATTSKAGRRNNQGLDEIACESESSIASPFGPLQVCCYGVFALRIRTPHFPILAEQVGLGLLPDRHRNVTNGLFGGDSGQKEISVIELDRRIYRGSELLDIGRATRYEACPKECGVNPLCFTYHIENN